MKINNLTYREIEFNNYYLISKEWILLYKKFYHYNEICKMIQKKDELKNLLNKGFESAKKNIRDVLKHISFKGTKKHQHWHRKLYLLQKKFKNFIFFKFNKKFKFK